MEPRVSFGIIVLNGEPFTRYCLQSLYPFAHEIVVVEGATQSAAALASQDGHSKDRTLETIREFQKNQDPEGKVHLITRSGFWNDKDEQSRAYAERSTGNYLWQVDIDEFYKSDHMRRIIGMLQRDPHITAISFRQITFWGGFDFQADSWYLRCGAQDYHRLFRWRKDYRYVTHRPPTVEDSSGRDLRSCKWIRAEELHELGIVLYHYSLVFPFQVRDKALYYSTQKWPEYSDHVIEWANENFLRPIRFPFFLHNVHTYPGWLRQFNGSHPEQIQLLQQDIASGRIKASLRENKDAEQLMKLRPYRIGRWILEHVRPDGGKFTRQRWIKVLRHFQYDSANNRITIN